MTIRLVTRILLFSLLLLLFAACATAPVKLATLPEPPASAKLRVAVLPFTGTGTFGTTHEVFVANQIVHVERYLHDTGIYEVVGREDVQKALGGQELGRWQVERGGWALAREIGASLHAEYVLVVERSLQRKAQGLHDHAFETVLVGTRSGGVYTARAFSFGQMLERDPREQVQKMVQSCYRDLFAQARQDMLAAAVRKSGRTAPPSGPGPAVPQRAPEPPKPMEPSRPAPPAVTAPAAETTGTRLMVYDFETADQDRTVALILAEILREELFQLKRFVLVNREDLQRIGQELALQQSGLIDEKQAVQLGKALAAREMVTGKLGVLGKTYVLQTKRTDVESFATLGIASVRFSQGQEEEALTRIPGMARTLSGAP